MPLLRLGFHYKAIQVQYWSFHFSTEEASACATRFQQPLITKVCITVMLGRSLWSGSRSHGTHRAPADSHRCTGKPWQTA